MIEISNILEAKEHIKDLKVIIFDLDDTLYGEKQYVFSGYKKIADYFGISEIANDMWTVFKNGGKAIDEVLEKYQLSNYKEKALEIYRFQDPEITLYPGVSEMVKKIKSSKKVGIITDGRPEGQRAKLKALNLKVDKIIITDELGGLKFRKPNPLAFELMKDYFEVEFNEMCYIGDNINKDFISPLKLGMKTIYFKNKDGLYYRDEKRK